ncbi:MAG: Rieske 2Fe-2S domain-containing protein, partial [Candidatus Binatia bacterium]
MPWIKIAKTADIPDGEIRTASAGGKKVAVARIGEEFFAIDDTCTHAQCSLGEGALIDHEVECPCHGSRF